MAFADGDRKPRIAELGDFGYDATPENSEVFMAFTRQHNTAGSLWEYGVTQRGLSGVKDDAFDITQVVKGSVLEDYPGTWSKIWNEEDFRFMERRVQRELDDQETIANSTWMQMIGVGGVALLADPTNLLFASKAFQAYRATQSIVKTAKAGGKAAFGTELIAEGVLYSTQDARELQHSALNVAFGTLTGGIVSGMSAAVKTGSSALAARFAKVAPTPDKVDRANAMMLDPYVRMGMGHGDEMVVFDPKAAIGRELDGGLTDETPMMSALRRAVDENVNVGGRGSRPPDDGFGFAAGDPMSVGTPYERVVGEARPHRNAPEMAPAEGVEWALAKTKLIPSVNLFVNNHLGTARSLAQEIETMPFVTVGNRNNVESPFSARAEILLLDARRNTARRTGAKIYEDMREHVSGQNSAQSTVTNLPETLAVSTADVSDLRAQAKRMGFRATDPARKKAGNVRKELPSVEEFEAEAHLAHMMGDKVHESRPDKFQNVKEYIELYSRSTRENFTGLYTKDAADLGMIPEGHTPESALSYGAQIWNKDAVENGRDQTNRNFTDMVMESLVDKQAASKKATTVGAKTAAEEAEEATRAPRTAQERATRATKEADEVAARAHNDAKAAEKELKSTVKEHKAQARETSKELKKTESDIKKARAKLEAKTEARKKVEAEEDRVYFKERRKLNRLGKQKREALRAELRDERREVVGGRQAREAEEAAARAGDPVRAAERDFRQSSKQLGRAGKEQQDLAKARHKAERQKVVDLRKKTRAEEKKIRDGLDEESRGLREKDRAAQKALREEEVKLKAAQRELAAANRAATKAKRAFEEAEKDQRLKPDLEEKQLRASEIMDHILGMQDTRVAGLVWGKESATRFWKERTFNPDPVNASYFLHLNLADMIEIYHKSVAPDVVLFRRFGGVDLDDLVNRKTGKKYADELIQETEENYRRLVPQVGEQEARRVTQRELKDARRDLTNGLLVLRNQHIPTSDAVSRLAGVAPESWLRFADTAVGNARKSATAAIGGNMALSSVLDTGNMALFLGLKNMWGQAWEGYVKRLTLSMNRKVVHELGDLAGIGGDAFGHGRVEQIFDLDHSFGQRGRFTKVMDTLSDHYWFANGMIPWNYGGKFITGEGIYRNMIRNIAKDAKGTIHKVDRDRLRQHSISPADSRRIAELLRDFGDIEDGAFVANVGEWKPRTKMIDVTPGARARGAEGGVEPGGVSQRQFDIADETEYEIHLLKNKFLGAIRTQVDNVIVTPGPFDRPWIMLSTQMMRTWLHLRTFAVTSMTNITVPMAQMARQAPFRVVNAIAAATAVGAIIQTAKAVADGRPIPEWDEMLWDSVLSTGMFEMANQPIDLGQRIGYFVTGVEGGPQFNRWNPEAAVMGPTFSHLQNVNEFGWGVADTAYRMGGFGDGGFSAGTINAGRRAMWLQNIFYLNRAFDFVQEYVGGSIRGTGPSKRKPSSRISREQRARQ